MNTVRKNRFIKLFFIKSSKLSLVTIVISLLFTGLFLTIIPTVSAEIFCQRCSNTNGCEWAKFYTDSSICNSSAGPNSNPYGVQRESRPPTQCAPISGGDNTRCSAYTNNPKGSLDEVNLEYGYVRGWACDNDDNNNQIWVHIYADGAMQGAVQATLERSDVASQCGGTTAHGFVVSLPSAIRDGNARQIHAYGINDYVGGNPELWNSPQPYQAKDCARCSSNYGCTWSVFVARDTTCTNPISTAGYTPTYSTDTNCSPVNPIPSGGNNDRCPIPTATRTPTPTSTPTPKTCTQCSANFGCRMATFQSNDNCVNPLPGTTPEYETNTVTCGIINPLPPGGNNDSCAVSCGRCSTLYGCRYANFKTLDACRNATEAQTAQPYGTVEYETDQVRCPALKPPPEDGNNNYCQTNSCSRCSNTRGCSLATFQTYNKCSTPAEAASAQPVGTVQYDKDTNCPRLTTIPDGGDNLNCPALTAPDITFTTDDNDNLTIKTISSAGGPVTLQWNVSSASEVNCQATGDWFGSKSVPNGTQTISLPANSGPDQEEYTFTLTCTNESPAYAIVKIYVEPESSSPPTPGDRTAEFEQTSGIIFNGGRSIGGLTNPDIGKLSERSWLVGGALDGASEEIASYKSPSLTTSYNYLLSAQDQTTLKNFSEINCTSGSCEPLLESGVYHITDDLPGNQPYTFDLDQTIDADAAHPNGKKIVVLVDGDFILTKKIIVDTKSIFILAVKGDIIVDQSLGQRATYACNVAPTLASLQGIFSAQGDFNVKGIGPATVCSPNKDQMLIIDGSVITNADLAGGGRFINGRDLCENNLLYPAVSIRQRADFIVNLPEFVKRQKLIFKEINP